MKPTPQERDVVIYDGNCSFCRSQVKRLKAWDGGDRLQYLSLHDDVVAATYPDLSHEDLMKEMYVVDRNGRRHGGAKALRYLSRRLPRLWILMPLLHIPGTLGMWNALYQLIARRRYRISSLGEDAAGECSNGACRIPSQSDRSG
jgi:predicted DCC family thiol-disulfide oxidoreductase YuxK